MNGLKIKVEKSRVTSITDEAGNELKWVRGVVIELFAEELPRLTLEINPEMVELDILDTVLHPDMNEELLKAIAKHHGYDLVGRCDDDTTLVAIEQDLSDSQ